MIAPFHFDIVSLHSIAQVSAARIVDCVVEGTLVAAFAFSVLRVVRRLNSGTRFAVWLSALLAMAALPVLGAMFGGTRWGVGSAGPSAAVLARPQITLPGSWALWLFGAWAGIAAFGLARVGLSLWRLCELRRSCVAVDAASLDPETRETLASISLSSSLALNRDPDYGKSRSAALCVSDAVSVPTVIGFVRPAVVIPRWLMGELSPAELKQVVLHELAHLERWDDWTNLTQKILKALLFFHPAVWWIDRQLSLEREMACDDAVVAETENPRAYAECLTHLAEKSFVRRSLALAQAALGRIRQTSQRVAQILNADRSRTRRENRKPAMALVAGVAIVCAGALSKTPKLVGFEDNASGFTQIAGASSAPTIPASFVSMRDQQTIGVESREIFHPAKAQFRKRQPRAALHKSSPRTLPPNTEVAQRVSAPDESAAPESWSVAIINANALMPVPPALASDLLCWTDFANGPRPVTETVFVVVEGGGPALAAGSAGTAAYRVSVWRIVLRPPVGNSNTSTIPHKET
jgi:Zn-dependent protease with chaperone function